MVNQILYLNERNLRTCKKFLYGLKPYDYSNLAKKTAKYQI